MKDHLETAPVIDALHHGDCPFCQLRDMSERQTIERYLGGAVTEPCNLPGITVMFITILLRLSGNRTAIPQWEWF